MFATGRTIKQAGLGEPIKPITCDHTNGTALPTSTDAGLGL